MEKSNSYYKKHMVLVHGACHGAWVWYKVKPILEAAGHRVTVLDMAASGTHPKKIHELQTIHDYSEPLIQLIASLPDDQKVILVGHSFGGINIAMVMEMFPHKIEIAIFVGANLPDTQHTPSFIFDQLAGGGQDYWLDTEFEGSGDPKETFTTMLFGPQYLAKRLYQFSPPEDFELVMTLKRTSSLFLHDLRKPKAKLTKERYGSVRTVYVICDQDQGILVDFQRWMIQNHGVKEVKELKGSDHMPMFCMPKKLCDCIMDIIAQK